MFHRIETVQTAPRRNVLLTYCDGTTVLVDFSPIIDRGGIFAALDDEQAFQAVRIEDDGHTLVWPGGSDFSADRLWERGTKVGNASDSDGDQPPATPSA